MTTTQGTRVENVEAVMHGERGAYCPVLDDAGAVKWLWMRLPSGSFGRIAAKGHGQHGEPEWTITVDPDETVTVDPSIEQHAITYEHGHATIPYWHGHLRAGVWEG